MALPSQMERNSDLSRSVMGEPGGRGPSPLLKILMSVAVLLLLAGGVYAMTKWLPARKPELLDHAGKAAVNSDKQSTRIPGTGPLAANTNSANSALVPSTISPGTQPVPTAQAPTPVTIVQGSNGNNTVQTAVHDPLRPVEPLRVATTPLPGATQGSTTPLGAPVEPPALSAAPSGVFSLIAAGEKAASGNRLVEARAAFNAALLSKDASVGDKDRLRAKLTALNDDLLFSPRIDAGDPLVETYRVQSGDSLEKIARRRELATDWRLIQRVNRIDRPERIRVGQTLKLVKGPFHAVVTKSEYRVDIYSGAPAEPNTWTFIKGFRCGLGESNTTPLGEYIVKRGSKLMNPHWVNPRNGERFDADDAKNPIGEHWIGWQGVGESAKNQGFGFHGTIDPGSIGQQKSMGCVRLAADDVKMLYELMVEDVSVVRVLP